MQLVRQSLLKCQQEIYDEGIRVFGENKVQELVDKYEVLPEDIRWQMIGHLQRNKVKYIIDKVDLIHSVDSIRLAESIDKEAEKRSHCQYSYRSQRSKRRHKIWFNAGGS